MRTHTIPDTVRSSYQYQPIKTFRPGKHSIVTYKHRKGVTLKLKTLIEQPRQIFSALAHEIRNPLTNINLSIEMLQAALNNDDLKIYLDIITRGSNRINELVTELLKSAECVESKMENHSIHQLLNEVVDMAKDRLSLKNIHLTIVFAVADCEVLINKPKIKIALTNIIVNALEAMSAVKGELMLVTKKVDGGVLLQIEDNGCGISAENLKSIFTPFFTKKSNGLGLGLSEAYAILQENKVKLDVESAEGSGTKFLLLFKTAA